MHEQVAAFHGAHLLELGAGTLNHVPYEHNVETYDIVEPFYQLFDGRPELASIRSVYQDISAIRDRKYNKIASIAVLEHLTNLPRVIALCGLLLEPHGRFCAGIPSEGGLGIGLETYYRLIVSPSYRS
jgi:hypothetical protein